ncbi:pseudouridine synthase [Mycoplasma sp. Ms02]|uniref:pseudouridine synthase n=1 Tax=Mycoplasma sp. Ms02 TaxID=353851 RepID=UPI001C8A1F83|nr:RluA family pseudouridine synthase [Mycoplasma sp. Ms02]QZE12552.1 RluA family pseudouridine synthase [Mycoplasma sp. Ms02]
MEFSKFKATQNDDGRTLLKVLSRYFEAIPASRIERIFRKNDVKINNNRKVSKTTIVNMGDEIMVYGISKTEAHQTNNDLDFKSVEIKFKNVYEDENILVVDKPINIAMHSEDNSLDMQVLKYLKFKKVDSFVPSHIGRLDKEVSGLVVYAKNLKTQKQLERQNTLTKIYMFKSDFNVEKQVVSGYIYKNEAKKKMSFSKKFVEGSKPFETILYIEKKRKFAQITTGRKHQIRLSLSAINCPIWGDRKYGGKKHERLMLHSYIVKFDKLRDELAYLNKSEFVSEPKW